MVYNIDHWDEGVKQNGWWHAVETGMFGVGAAFGMHAATPAVSTMAKNANIFAREFAKNTSASFRAFTGSTGAKIDGAKIAVRKWEKGGGTRRLANNIRLPRETLANFRYSREIRHLLPRGVDKPNFDPNHITHGTKFKWTNSNGNKIEVRIHSIDSKAPAGSNASLGWIGRVEIKIHGKGKNFLDSNGVLHQANTTIKNDPILANDTHIPIEKLKEAIRKFVENSGGIFWD